MELIVLGLMSGRSYCIKVRRSLMSILLLGECSADPTLCRSGVTIFFWLKMEQNPIAKMKSQGFNEFYIWASGGLQIKNRYNISSTIFSEAIFLF